MAERVSSIRDIADAAAAWLREERTRVGSTASDNVSALLRELGYVSRTEHDELILRVAQLEHRVRLLESEQNPSDVDAADPEPRPAH
ncbi:MAG TPA: hypothetical protein VE444_02755 [Gaiellaceae bacterium]|jgi:polyhydroxyalkanoate synthesis regulator phasin|nr:hypothetical protein [Gaiellaceae bacterium]